MDSERRNRTGLAQPYESCRIARPRSPWGVRLWEESNLRPRASHARVLSSELQRLVMEWGRTESNCQSRRRVVYSHLGSPHSQCIPTLRALGRIRTSNHQVRSLALWSVELRGRVSCTCEWRMRASNPPVVPGANRVTTPSSPIPQSSASTGRGSRTPTENLHWFLRPARLPIPPYRCVVKRLLLHGDGENRTRDLPLDKRMLCH